MPEKADITDLIDTIADTEGTLKTIVDDIIQNAKIIGIPQGITATELMTMVYPEIRYIIPNILPEGAVIIAGKPKIGKSFMAINLAISVAEGGYALGKIPVNQ